MKLSAFLKIALPLLIVGLVGFYFLQFVNDDNVEVAGESEEKTEESVVAEDENVVIDERTGEKIARGVEEELGSDEEVIEKSADESAVRVTDEDLIKKYYENLQTQKLEYAYLMKYDTKAVSFSKFKGWYGNVEIAEVSDIVGKGDNRYQFKVYLKEKNNVEERYLVDMEVIDGLLKTHSSQKTWDNNSVEVYFDIVNGVRKIHVIKNGIDRLVASIDENEDVYLGTTYDSHKISADKKYLMYTLLGNGYALRDVHVYDIDAGREVFVSNAPDAYGFSKDSKYFYECRGKNDYMGGEYLYVYSVPVFDEIFDFQASNSGDGVTVCQKYDVNTNDFNFMAKFTENRVFDFDSGKLQ